MRRIGGYIRRHHVALLALFVALGGTSYAVIRVPARSVGTRQLRNGAVTRTKLAKGIRHGLRGARGAKGHVGATGLAGPAGARGHTGARGTDGALGPTFATTQRVIDQASVACDVKTLVDQTITVSRPTRLLVLASADVQSGASGTNGADVDTSVLLFDASATTKLADTEFDQVEPNLAQSPTVVQGVLGVLNAGTGQRDPYVAQPGTYRVQLRASHAGTCATAVGYGPGALTTMEIGTADG
jgi:hypothetical protein